ncbi:MAG: replication-relaxation family protein [Actinomycetota bacterium]|nr:replication-relaxation family protein [Actinomycetota bacterium]
MGTVRKSYPRFRREGGAPRIVLTEDDFAILLCIYRHRFVRADDLYRLFVHRSRDRLSRRLTWLYRNQFLDRPIAQIDRFREGPTQALVYGLDNAGARVVAERFGVPTGSADWRSRNRAFTRENLDHTLAVTRFMVDLELACRERQGVCLMAFDEILVGAPETTRRAPFPGRWAVPVSWSMGRTEVQVMPDGIFGLRVTRTDGSAVESFLFLEIDRGGMTIVPTARGRESEGFLYRATVLRKLLAYAESWRRSLHKERFGLPNARTLFLTTTEARAEAMRSAAEAHVLNRIQIPGGAFLFGASDYGREPTTAVFSDSFGNATLLLP